MHQPYFADRKLEAEGNLSEWPKMPPWYFSQRQIQIPVLTAPALHLDILWEAYNNLLTSEFNLQAYPSLRSPRGSILYFRPQGMLIEHFFGCCFGNCSEIHMKLNRFRV